MARSLKKGCNDHITEIVIIQDKLVNSTVKAKSNKRQKTTSKGQEIAAQEAAKAATEKRRLKKQASDKIRTSRLKKQATDKIKTSSAREAAAKKAAIIQSKNINSKIQNEAAKRKKAVKKNSKEDKRLDAVERNWDRMVQVVDDRNAAADRKKKESKAAKKKKKQGGQKKIDETQYEIEAIVGHEIGKKSKKVARLCIKWVGHTQTTMEFVKDIKETAWEMVEEYGKKKNITI